MTDRHSGYIVVLRDDIREDDAEAVVNALRMVKGVLRVEPIVSDGHAELIAERRVRTEVSTKLYELAREILG